MNPMIRTTLRTAIAIGVFAVCACQKSEPEGAPPDADQQEVQAAVPEQPRPPAPPEPASAESEPKTDVKDGIPTEEDFEEEAQETITAENLEAELDRLEAEIKAN
jgi:hypothetical protein